jgi:protoporphyrinogen oxidase
MYSQFILGAGVTGLAAGYVSGLSIYEAAEYPGGICASYYVCPGNNQRLQEASLDQEVYRFEIGGGHWIFGGDPLVLRFIRSLTPVKSYIRRSAVYFPEQELLVPYPLQNHLRYLGQKVAAQALQEIFDAQQTRKEVVTMADWLRANFGPTLCELFFEPFHELYTAGLFREIAPQDAYKTPVDLSLVIQRL